MKMSVKPLALGSSGVAAAVVATIVFWWSVSLESRSVSTLCPDTLTARMLGNFGEVDRPIAPRRDSPWPGQTALMIAAGCGSIDAVDLLLASGAGVNAADEGGHTPVMYAAGAFRGGRSSHAESARAIGRLIEAGAELDAVNMGGRSALLIAIYMRDWEVCQLLIDAGASVEIVDSHSTSVVETAAIFGRPEVIQGLASRGLSFDAIDEDGNMLLHLAARGSVAGSQERFKALIEAGIDPAHLNNSGETAHDVASADKYLSRETVDVLKP
jgi:ankyrin repeat protein